MVQFLFHPIEFIRFYQGVLSFFHLTDYSDSLPVIYCRFDSFIRKTRILISSFGGLNFSIRTAKMDDWQISFGRCFFKFIAQKKKRKEEKENKTKTFCQA